MMKINRIPFSIVSRNIRSLTAQTNAIRRPKVAWLNSRTEDIILVQETFCYKYDITGYRCTHKPRPQGRGGGVSIYVRDHYKVRTLNDTIADTLIILVETQDTNQRAGAIIVNSYFPTTQQPVRWERKAQAIRCFFSDIKT